MAGSDSRAGHIESLCDFSLTEACPGSDRDVSVSCYLGPNHARFP